MKAEEKRNRIARMRREKQLQLQRRRRMKFLLRLLALILAVLLPAGLLIRWKAGSAGEMVEGTAIKTEAATEKAAEKGEVKSGGQLYTKDQVRPVESGVTAPIGQNNIDIATTRVDSETPLAMRESLPSSFNGFAKTAETRAITEEEIFSTYALLVDEESDTIVGTRLERERICPASMTKVLTILVAAEAITEEQLDDTFTVTREITDYGFINDCSMVGFLEGEEVTVRDLFYGTVLSSGADAALGLAIYTAGSQEAFMERMNRKLEELGLSESAHFTNCVGLYDEEHYCSLYDMAVMMKAAIRNEWCKTLLAARTYTTAATPEHPEGIAISNWFIRRIEDKDTGGKVVAAKTGYVIQSGNCAVSYGEFAGGKTYICVTADAHSSWRSIYDHVEIYNCYTSDK